ncbi:MAG: T9SS type A sorting domain-containing protein [Bacteroidota bacterium]
MNRRWLMLCHVLAVVMIAGLVTDTAVAQNNVTFRVNMSIKMREGTFLPGSGDIVRVAGSFNNWGSSTDTLTKGVSDSIFSKTISLSAGGIQYKFLKTLRGGLDWESDPPNGPGNRSYTVVAGAQTLPVVWFDNDSVFTPAVNVNVTFRVNMAVKMQENTFLPDSGDIVRVAGSFNSWGSSTDTLTKGPTDSIYSKTISLLENTAIQYKFLKTTRGGLDWEQDPPNGPGNRSFTVPVGGGSPAVAYFNDDAVVNTPVNTNILWEVDMKTFQQLGWFDPSKDTMQVRGGFEGWSGTDISQDFIQPNLFNITLGYIGTSGDVLDYKFFIKQDSATAFARWGADYDSHKDDYNYEHPAERGDGNQKYTVIIASNQGPTTSLFSQIHPRGLFNATDSTNVTFTVNMGPAKRYSNPFVPATDTVKLVIYNRLWLASQWKSQGAANFTETKKLTLAAGGGDSVYTVTIKVKGKTHYNILYYYRVNKSDGTSYDEGGGLGKQNPYRSRFIRNGEAGAWGPAYNFPQDTWQKDAPMPGETALYPTDVQDLAPGEPLVYKLSQNYPNPFNPVTVIRYSLPTASHVSLKVFNILGQEVATLVNGVQPQGQYVQLFEARNLASGVYFYRLEAGPFTDVKKMLLLK